MVDESVTGLDKAAIGAGGESLQVGAESVRQQAVIRIEKDNIVAGRQCESAISSRRESLIILVVAANHGEPSNDRLDRVGRAIVDDDDFERRIVLRKHTFHRLCEKVSLPIARDDDRDELRHLLQDTTRRTALKGWRGCRTAGDISCINAARGGATAAGVMDPCNPARRPNPTNLVTRPESGTGMKLSLCRGALQRSHRPG